MKKILLILFAFCTLMGAVKAQEDATISPDQIEYWVGEGENEAIFIVSWCEPEVALAWGYRFDEDEVTVQTMMEDIAAADERFFYDGGESVVNQIYYQDEDYDFSSYTAGMYGWWLLVNSESANWGYTTQTVTDGDVIKWGDTGCSPSEEFWVYYWTTPVTPVSNPNAGEEVVDATISADEIEYWVGEGENEVVVAISWCSNTEAALAWGYRFDGEATVFQALTDIAAADSRLTVVGAAPSNITYQDDELDLTMQPNPNAQWGDPDYDVPMHSVNGLMGQNAMSAEPIHDNDFVKIGGVACGIMSDDWTAISWTTTIEPATEPEAEVVDATIDADQIEYWVGEGENEVVVAISWCSNTEAALAWGYRFDGEATVFQALTDIAAADSRLTVVGTAPTNITYQDDELDLTMQPNPNAQWGDPDYDVPMHSVNGMMGMNAMSAEPIHDNDFVKIGGVACGIMADDWSTISWSTPIVPATEPEDEVVDATISADEVEYWLGEGENQVVVAISWCSNTETALAWGYRFHGDATVFDALTAIAAADSHLAVVGAAPSNVTYQDGELDLTMQPNPNAQWGDPDYDAPMHSINGLMGQNYMAAEPIHDGDFVKIGGSACGIFSDDWTVISWTTTINPATAPTEVGPSDETFDGIVGTEGCQGIHCQDPAILGWATTCTIERGRQDITTPGVFATYGTENDGVGAATESTADVVSLGDYGIAVLTFDIPIQNGDGYDFAVFENSLNDSFLEMAFVEVSSDGVNYFRFPAISNSDTIEQVNNGGSVDASLIHNLAGKYKAGWGTPFDLAELEGTEGLDVNNITHIRLIDVVGCIAPRYATRDSRGHIINDPYPTPFHSSGFDLDGVAVMNGWRPNGVEENTMVNHTLTVYPNPCHSNLTLNTEAHDVVMLFNMQGALVQRVVATDNTTTLNMQDLPAGLYIVRCGNQSVKVIKQ
ncbi:MAG: T9SS type A sorting domain-containing protein [Bacteroidales bacterium]|nr:T9SS type A sorting domain-containing protein [Bacteroidales bacterium]